MIYGCVRIFFVVEAIDGIGLRLERWVAFEDLSWEAKKLKSS